jgi:hypothetical protein
MHMRLLDEFDVHRNAYRKDVKSHCQDCQLGNVKNVPNSQIRIVLSSDVEMNRLPSSMKRTVLTAY